MSEFLYSLFNCLMTLLRPVGRLSRTFSHHFFAPMKSTLVSTEPAAAFPALYVDTEGSLYLVSEFSKQPGDADVSLLPDTHGSGNGSFTHLRTTIFAGPSSNGAYPLGSVVAVCKRHLEAMRRVTEPKTIAFSP